MYPQPRVQTRLGFVPSCSCCVAIPGASLYLCGFCSCSSVKWVDGTSLQVTPFYLSFLGMTPGSVFIMRTLLFHSSHLFSTPWLWVGSEVGIAVSWTTGITSLGVCMGTEEMGRSTWSLQGVGGHEMTQSQCRLLCSCTEEGR